MLYLSAATTFAQTDPIQPGCYDYAVLDQDNDGYITIDSDYFVHGYAIPMISAHIQYNLEANYQMALTAWNYDGFVSGNWTTATQGEQTVEIQYSYVGPDAAYQPSVYYEGLNYHSCFIVKALDPNGDTDQDGIPDADEDENGDGILENDDSDGNGIPNYRQSALTAADFSRNDFKIFPNPTSNRIAVGGVENASFTISDLNGRALKQSENTNEIDVSELSSGVYLIRISSDKKTQTKRFIKQ